MATVAIPDIHFLRSIKLQYSDPSAAIVRETLQNSLDAGASRIAIETGEDWASFNDDGSGMTPERMIDALLTFGGSFKPEGSIGGYGIAKELILFSHFCYRIESNETIVDGRVLNYEMRRAESPRKGTLIRISPVP